MLNHIRIGNRGPSSADPLTARTGSPAHKKYPAGRCVLLIGHFTPPIHGMAKAMDEMAALLGAIGPIGRIRTVPHAAPGGGLYHVRRVVLVLGAISRLFTRRARGSAVWLSVDAGKGMLYVIALAWVSRRLGYRLVLQHHSYAYVARKSRIATLLVRASGPRAIHVHSCNLACHEFRRLYPRAVLTRAVSVAYALDPVSEGAAPADTCSGRMLTVGHLSNLSLAKGLGEVVRLGHASLQAGVVGRVILAGPVSGSAERKMLNGVSDDSSFEYRGRVTGKRKEEFFRDIDVFLFPSRYKNESYGLVAWEAMLRGVPVIAYRAGCLTQAAAGEASLVLEHGDDFTRSGLRRIDRWFRSPAEFSDAKAAAAQVAHRERERAVSDALQLGAELFAAPPVAAPSPTAR
jgi:glycosyltransferase involved in cell wall biosynthesis